VLITDHNVRETLRIVDRAYLIDEGRVLCEGTSDFWSTTSRRAAFTWARISNSKKFPPCRRWNPPKLSSA